MTDLSLILLSPFKGWNPIRNVASDTVPPDLVRPVLELWVRAQDVFQHEAVGKWCCTRYEMN
jgi:hypothetical protein